MISKFNGNKLFGKPKHSKSLLTEDELLKVKKIEFTSHPNATSSNTI